MMNFRTDDERADLIAAARAMREAGVVMHEVSRQLGVPVSTLHRWAAERGWRTMDLASARTRAVFSAAQDRARRAALAPAGGDGGAGAGGPPDAPDAADRIMDELLDLPGEDRGAEPGAGTDAEAGACAGAEAGAEAGDEPPHVFIHPLQARAAGEQALRAAEALMQAGELKAATQTMNLAERLLGAARVLEALPLPARADPEYQRRQEEAALEVRRRMHNLVYLALCGNVRNLPRWAKEKGFLKGTLYEDQYTWEDNAQEG
ncbi:hypothetical protein L2D00_11625 [Hyphomonadaceae bacterium BL14]|nr:hypothetical protein L2D00_11625 [Hyphomonadaceae bacterium BL14]